MGSWFLDATRGDSTCAARVFFWRPACPLVQRAPQPAPSMPALHTAQKLLSTSRFLSTAFPFFSFRTSADGCSLQGWLPCHRQRTAWVFFFFAFLGCRHGQLAVDLARLRGF